MKRIIVSVIVGIVVGFSLGWYFGYTRPAVVNQRKILKEYEVVRDNFQMTDVEMADFAVHRQEYFDALKREDELASAIALGAFKRLVSGDVEGTERLLAMKATGYYRAHRSDGDSNLLAAIERAGATNATIAYWLTNKYE